ncbi:MAG: M13 family metallopeptidase [Syntrophomonas sp.]|nr:M13 family metallopeptidase [Syntrophomonas sp.]
MKFTKCKVLAWLVMITFIISVSPAMVGAEDTPVYLTRGQVAKTVLNAADDYNPGISEKDIMQGFGDGYLRKEKLATKAQALSMISRAFGKLPSPQGNSLRMSVFDQYYNDVSVWAGEAIDKLQKAGILYSSVGGELGANENISAVELDNIIKRIWALEGSNLKDDFYATVNKEWLDSSTIPAGEAGNGTLAIMGQERDQRISDILDTLVQGEWTPGSKEQKLADFYQSVLDMDNRNKQGIEPVKKYLQAYEDAKSLEQLIQTDININRATGYWQFLNYCVYADPKDSSKNIMYHQALTPTWEKDMYTSSDKQKACIKFIAGLLTLSGENEAIAQTEAEKIFTLEKELSANSLDPEEYYDSEKTYNIYTMDQLDSLYSNVDIKKTITGAGYSLPDKVLVMDKGLLLKSAQYFNPEQLKLLKSYAKYKFIYAAGPTLANDFTKAVQDFEAEVYGSEGIRTNKQMAAIAVQNYLPAYLGGIYVEKYFSEQAKRDVKTMVANFIAVYKQKINNLDWMSKETKQRALKKLDTMNVKIGYPDKWPAILDNITVKSYTKEGSYFDNVCQVNLANMKDNIAQQGQPVDKSTWEMNVYEVNAYYNPQNNEIVFAAGMLQDPFYSYNASPAANLGGIGVAIAHEISHAFDTNGSKYDEKGNLSNWWTEEDYRQFMEKAGRVEKFYDGLEIAAGIENDGELTLFENVADLGGISCALQVLSESINPDYQAFFKSYAVIWAQTYSREKAENLSKNDVHSNRKIRTNRNIVNFEEFYKAFDITPKDGMYVPPAERVGIW